MITCSHQSEILLVVPCFNHGDFLDNLLYKLILYGPVLVVDDGSSDHTSQVLQSWKNKISVLRHDLNLGKGMALRSAEKFASSCGYKWFISIDADGQHDPADLSLFFDKISSVSSDDHLMIIGSRQMRKPDSGDVPFSSLFGRAFSNFWVWIETGLWLEDTQSGFRAYPVDLYLFNHINSHSYQAEIEVLVRAIWSGCQVAQVAVRVWYPDRKKRVSHFNPVRDNALLSILHTKLCCIRLLISIKKIKLFLLHKAKHRIELFWRSISDLETMRLMVTFFGRTISYLVAIVPVTFYYLRMKKVRNSLRSFYRNIPDPHFFSGPWFNFMYFAVALIDRMYFVSRPDIDRALSEMDFHASALIPGSVFVGAHFGEWVICGFILRLKYNLRIAMVVNETITPSHFAAIKKMTQNQIKFIHASSEQNGLLLKLKDLSEEGYCIGFMGDRPVSSEYRWEIPFLNKNRGFSSLPFEFARIIDVPVHMFVSYKTNIFPCSRYQLCIFCLRKKGDSEGSRKTAEKFARHLESLVRLNPVHWFNFSEDEESKHLYRYISNSVVS